MAIPVIYNMRSVKARWTSAVVAVWRQPTRMRGSRRTTTAASFPCRATALARPDP